MTRLDHLEDNFKHSQHKLYQPFEVIKYIYPWVGCFKLGTDPREPIRSLDLLMFEGFQHLSV